MAGMHAARRPGLQAAERSASERRERMAWGIRLSATALLGAMVTLAAINRSDDGSSRSRVDSGEASVLYEQEIGSAQATKLDVDAPVDGGRTSVSFNTEFLDGMEVAEVEPRPDQVLVHDQETTYVFASSREHGVVPVTFTLRIQQAGVHSAEVTTGSQKLSFWQFAFP